MTPAARAYRQWERRQAKRRAAYRHYSHTPDAPARLIPPDRPGECYLWEVIACPYCGLRHIHGAGLDPKTDPMLGHRAQHCLESFDDMTGYNLVRAEPEARE